VTHDVVDRRAHGFPEPLIVQWRWVRVIADDQLVHETVYLVGGDAGPNHALGVVQHELGQLTAVPQQLYSAVGVDFWRGVLVRFVHHVAGSRVTRRTHVLRHRLLVAHVPHVHDGVVRAEVRFEQRPQRRLAGYQLLPGPAAATQEPP